jgi:hypothetical protein
MTTTTTMLSTTTKTLSAKERHLFDELEATIRDGLRTFYEVGAALRTIRDNNLHREVFDTWEQYVKERWSMTRQRAFQLTGAADVCDVVLTVVNIAPQNEAQCRELSRIMDDDCRAEAWKRVVSTAPEVDGNKHITAKAVAKAVKEVRYERFPASRPTPHQGWITVKTEKNLIGDISRRINLADKGSDSLARYLELRGMPEWVEFSTAMLNLKDTWHKLKYRIRVRRKPDENSSPESSDE